MKQLRVLVGVVALAATVTVPAVAATPHTRPCTTRHADGGDWPMYGHDVENTRSQPEESALRPDALTTAWSFTTANGGLFNATPAVAGGCVYVGDDHGQVYAFDALTGGKVWETKVGEPAGPTVDALGGTIVGTPAVVGRSVIVLVSQNSDVSNPYAVALDASTGAIRWKSQPVTIDGGYLYTNASPVVMDGVLFFGLSGPEGHARAQGGWALLDAGSGAVLKVVSTIPPADQAEYGGGSIWSTPAYDAASGFAYVGAGNPFSKTVEHRYTNAILKIDMRRDSATFGEIVASYKGNVDQYSSELQALSQTPACAASADAAPETVWIFDDPVCGQLDLDFGASPNLFRTGAGDLVVGDLQKSGVYHVASTDDTDGDGLLEPRWTQLVGLSCAPCNAASTAFDGSSITGVGTPGGVMFSLARDTGEREWSWPVADGAHYQSMSTANGVVYTIDGWGNLVAVDAATGELITLQPVTGAPSQQLGSSGVTIAMHHLFATVNGSLVAFTAG